MKYIEVAQLQPNMIIANTLYDNHEKVLLKANKKISAYLIERIKEFHIPGVYVFEEDDILEHPHLVSEELRIKAVKNLKRLNIDDCIYIANQIIEEVKAQETIIIQSMNLYSYDSYTFHHCFDVNLDAVILGIALGLSDDELKKLSQAALLHDIGKTCIPIEVLNRPGKLSEDEYELIMQHPLFGYNMLKHNDEISSVTRNAILSHHENVDGTGYPRQLKGNKIHKFAKIIHIADVYDALTTKRVYKDAINPADAMEYLMANVDTMFDKEMVYTFIKYIAPYPIGVMVQLSNGNHAVVQKNNLDMLSRPIVRQLDGQVIDLYKTLDVTITKIVTRM